MEVQKERALRTRDSDMWSSLTSLSSVLVRGAVVVGPSSPLLFCGVWKAQMTLACHVETSSLTLRSSRSSSTTTWPSAWSQVSLRVFLRDSNPDE